MVSIVFVVAFRRGGSGNGISGKTRVAIDLNRLGAGLLASDRIRAIGKQRQEVAGQPASRLVGWSVSLLEICR